MLMRMVYVINILLMKKNVQFNLFYIIIMNRDIAISILLGIIISILFKYYFVSPTVVIEKNNEI